MKTNAIAKSLGKVGGKIRLAWKAHGATATFISGMAGSIASGVLGARGWVKAKVIIDEKDNQITEINAKIGTEIQVSETEKRIYTEEDAKKDLAKVKRQAFFGISKEMAPSFIVGGVSAGLLTYSHMNLKGQVSAIGAYATAIEGQLSNYRIRVANKIGKEEEEMLYQGVHKETVTETVVDPETGETTVNVEEILVKDMDIPVDGVFTFELNNRSKEWRPQRDYNLNAVSIAMSNLSDMKIARGFIELREIYDELGIPSKDRAACQTIVGCVSTGKIDDRIDYQIIDYGIDQNDPDVIFTVKTDGIILDKLKKLKEKEK